MANNFKLRHEESDYGDRTDYTDVAWDDVIGNHLDLMSSGPLEHLEWLRTVLAVNSEQAKFEKHMHVLNQVVRWISGIGAAIEAD